MEQISVALEPVRAFLVQLGIFLPKLFMAVIVLIAGWLIAKVLKFAVIKGLKAVNFNVLTSTAGLDGFLKQGGIKTDTTGILGLLVYWLVVLAALVVAFNGLGLAQVTDLLGIILLFIPRVIVAVVVLAIGLYFARFVANTVITYGKNVGMQDAELLGKITLYAIMTFVILIVLDQVNIGGDLVRLSFLIILAGVVLALSLAFGLGGQKWAADQLAKMQSAGSKLKKGATKE